MSLPDDSTIATVFHRLGKQVDYVSTVFGKINGVHRSDPCATVRIGIMGDGVAPNYRIEGGSGVITGPFRGSSHNLLPNGENMQDETWSSQVMTFFEVKSLLGQVR